MTKSDLLIVFAGFVLINGAALLIAARVKKYLHAGYAPYTFLLVLLLAGYYCLDVIRTGENLFGNYYFYLWILVMGVQAGLFVWAWQKRKDQADDIH